MEFLGIGGFELAVIFLILLIVAGPKRMIAWSYTLGKYVSVLRNMWAETAAMLQKEFSDAGVDVKIPTEPPTRGSINRMITNTVSKAAAPITEPLKEAQRQVQEPLKQAQRDIREPLKDVQKAANAAATPPLTARELIGSQTPRTLDKPVTEQPKPPAPTPPAHPAGGSNEFGAWTTPPPPAKNGEAPADDDANGKTGFGAWGG